MVELAVRIDKLIKTIKGIWGKLESAFNCFKIIVEEIIKIIGYSTSLWDAILSVFGKGLTNLYISDWFRDYFHSPSREMDLESLLSFLIVYYCCRYLWSLWKIP